MQRILLVEDSRMLKLMTQRLLSKAGYSVVTAEDGEEALALALKEPPDLVILDMLLPKLSGSQVLARMKANAATSKIPVIVLTGLSTRNAEKLAQAGASAFVEKNQMLEDNNILLNSISDVLLAIQPLAEIARPKAESYTT